MIASCVYYQRPGDCCVPLRSTRNDSGESSSKYATPLLDPEIYSDGLLKERSRIFSIRNVVADRLNEDVDCVGWGVRKRRAVLFNYILLNGKNFYILADNVLGSPVYEWAGDFIPDAVVEGYIRINSVSYTHLTLPTNREV